MRLLPALLPMLAVGLLVPASAAAAPDLATTASAAPSPARTGQDVTFTITTTNSSQETTTYPVFLRLEYQSGSFGTTSVQCPPGATQGSAPNAECRLGGPLGPGASVTMTVTGFATQAETMSFTGTGFTYDDPNRGNDSASGQVVIEGPTNDGSGAPGAGGSGAGLPPFALARPSVPDRIRSGRRVTVRTNVDRTVDLAVVVERQGRGGKFRRVRGTIRRRCRRTTPCVLRFARLDGSVLAPGSYRLRLIGTDLRGERAQSPRTRFRIRPAA